jgi:hypothetical protein
VIAADFNLFLLAVSFIEGLKKRLKERGEKKDTF